MSPQVWERHVALEAELALTLQVLGALAESSLGPLLAPALHTLSLIHAHLQTCVSGGHPDPICGTRDKGSPSSVPGPASYTFLCPQLHTQPKVEPHPQGHLHSWLERLQESGKKASKPGEVGAPDQLPHSRLLSPQESPSCLEASVTFHLFHLLIKGLKCVTPRNLCV